MFHLPEIIQLGPLSLPVPMGILILAFIAAGFILANVYKRRSIPINVWADTVISGIVIFIVGWKLSNILIHPLNVIHNPKSLLFGNSGVMGVVIGSMAALIGMYRNMRKKDFPLVIFLDITALWLVLSFTLYWFFIPSYGAVTDLPWGIYAGESEFRYHPLHLYRFFVGLIAIAYIWRMRSELGSGLLAKIIGLALGIGLLVVSLFQTPSITYGGLSRMQWIYIAVALAAAIFNKRKRSLTKDA